MATTGHSVTILTSTGDVVPNAPIEIRLYSTGGLANIFEQDGTQITQLGATADANGIFRFWAEPNEYFARHGGVDVPVTVGLGHGDINRLNPATMSDWQSDSSARVGDVVTTKERVLSFGGGATGDVISGTSTANGFDVVAHHTLDLSWSLRVGNEANIKQFGAIGDGVTDDTLAIQYVLDNHLLVHFPEGVYNVSKLEMQLFNSYINGAHSTKTIIQTSDSTNCITTGWNRTGVSGISIKQTNTTKTGKGLVGWRGNGAGEGCNFLELKDVTIDGFDLGMQMEKSVFHSYENLAIDNCTNGALFVIDTGAPNGTWFNNGINMVNCRFTNIVETGLTWSGIAITLTNCDAEKCLTGFKILGNSGNNAQSTAANIIGCYFELTNNPIVIDQGRATIQNSFFAGAQSYSSTGAGYFDAPVQINGNEAMVEIGTIKAWGYWLYKVHSLDPNSKVYTTDTLEGVISHNGFHYDAGNINTIIHSIAPKINDYVNFPQSRHSTNAPNDLEQFSTSFFTNTFGTSAKATSAVNKWSGDNSVLVISDTDAPTAGQDLTVSFCAQTPGLTATGTNFLGLELARIKVELPTSGSNGRDSRLVFGTGNEATSSSVIDRLQIDENGHFMPVTTGVCDIGSSSLSFRDVYSVNALTTTSDRRYKSDIKPSDLGLAFINSLKPKSYTLDEEKANSVHYGLLSQDVKETIDALDLDFAGWKIMDKENPDSKQGLRYAEFIAPLIKSVQDLSMQVTDLTAEVKELKNPNNQ